MDTHASRAAAPAAQRFLTTLVLTHTPISDRPEPTSVGERVGEAGHTLRRSVETGGHRVGCSDGDHSLLGAGDGGVDELAAHQR